jgi:hypothetical protein
MREMEVGQKYRMAQEERSVFWGAIVSVILSKKVYTFVVLRTVSEIELCHCTVPKLLIRKRYYVMFLIPVFIQTYWVLRLCPSSSTLETRKHNVSKSESVSVLRCLLVSRVLDDGQSPKSQ